VRKGRAGRRPLTWLLLNTSGRLALAAALGAAVSTAAWTAGVDLVLAALSALYVCPVALGPMARPSRGLLSSGAKVASNASSNHH